MFKIQCECYQLLCALLFATSYAVALCQVFLYFSHGPLLRAWCMRYEAKHHYFKHLCTVIGNYKNLSYTLAMRHQHWLCYMQQTGNYESSFIEKGLEIQSGRTLIHTHLLLYNSSSHQKVIALTVFSSE